MFSVPSLLRLEEHRAFSGITLSGQVLDLGGDKNSEYTSFFKGEFKITTVNISKDAGPDVLCDLEKPLPIADASFDHVLLVNALEHVFEYRALLLETVRVLKPKGSLVIVVPFLFPEHPSPNDYHRFTSSALRMELERLGFNNISVKTLGNGVFSTRYLLIDRLLPSFVRFFNYYTFRYLFAFSDYFLIKIAKIFNKKYKPEYYALGFCVVSKKTS